MDQTFFLNSKKAQYRRELHNYLAQVLQVLYSIQHQPNVDLKLALKALDLIEKRLPEAKRSIMFLINTEENK